MSINLAARLAACAASVIVAGTSLGLAATSADAASTVHTVKYTCKVPVVGTETVTARVTLVSATKSTVGSKVKLVVRLQPTGLPAISVTNLTVKSTLRVSGAQKGTVAISEFLRSANSGNLKLALVGTLKLTKSGMVHLTPGSSATFSLTSSIIGKTTLTCTAKGSMPMIGSIAVSKVRKHVPVTDLSPARLS
jgi:hypothetical protein